MKGGRCAQHTFLFKFRCFLAIGSRSASPPGVGGTDSPPCGAVVPLILISIGGWRPRSSPPTGVAAPLGVPLALASPSFFGPLRLLRFFSPSGACAPGPGDADGGDKANSTEEQPQAGESSGSGSDNAESAAVPGARAADVGKVVVAWVVAALVGALVVFPS